MLLWPFLNWVCFGALPRRVLGIVYRAAGGVFAFATPVGFFVDPASQAVPSQAFGFDILKALVRQGVDGLQAVNASNRLRIVSI